MTMEEAKATTALSPKEKVAEILLVEDDAVHASLTLRALKVCGFADRTEHVSDGAEALEYLSSVNLLAARQQTPTPKLILLDLGLPKISGLHVLRHLKSDPRTKSIPIVVLTSSKIAIELMESYKLGVNSYVIKPSDATKFVELIGEISRYWLVINEPPHV
jgi:CheY-like chemotaxis protein